MLFGQDRHPLSRSEQACLVFRKKDLYLIITQKLTFMKSGRFQVKSTQNLIKSDVSTKTLQFGGCMEVARPTILSRHLINFDLGKHFTKEGVYEPFLYYMDLFVL